MELKRETEQVSTLQGTEWSQTARIYDTVCREAGEVYGLDSQKLQLGHLVGRFRGDDRTAFFPIENLALNPDEAFDLSSAQWSRASALDRIDWEITSTVTPEPLREHLAQAKSVITQEDFQTRESGERALQAWLQERAWFIAEMQNHPEWEDAEKYYRENQPVIREYLTQKYTMGNERLAA